MKKKLRTKMCILCMLIMSILAVPTLSEQEVMAASSQNAETRAYIREWRYKMFGNHLYKRLFNASTGQWESDWIFVV